MKQKKLTIKFTKKDLLKALEKAFREEEIKVRVPQHKVHKNKKKYDRNKFRKERLSSE
jgi:hypothetical protein